jgi:hypothetical protein
MVYFAGLDVSVKDTRVCIVDGTGKIVREVKVASEPDALLAVLRNPAYRASLRSVLLICAFSTARMCRVSTQITGKSASASALNSHCDSGPASNPIRLKRFRCCSH